MDKREIRKTMRLLQIEDVTTKKQLNNGTVVWRLPIKINYPGNAERFIEVASFKTGYVRNQNCGYSNYQLNKRCDGEPEYFQLDNGDYRKFTTRSCVLIPNEIDRLEYLIAYCLKNYYIKNANQVANGGYVEQWYHDQQLDRNENKYSDKYKTDKLIKLRKEISDLESEARELETKYQSSQAELGRVQEQRDDLQHDLSEQKVRQDVSVIVNGHRYKVL
jgi:hypothetical protein